MVIVDYSRVPRKRVLSVLEDPEPPIGSLELGTTDNTVPTKDKGNIPRELVGNWHCVDKSEGRCGPQFA